MLDTALFKSLGASSITGGLTEMLKISLLYNNVSTKNTLLISLIISYSIAYVAQRYVFNGGRFFGLSLLKYIAVALLIVQFTNILLDILQNNETIKSYIEDKNISESQRMVNKYLLINATILTIFFCIDYPLRKSFIFLKNKETDYIRSYILYSISIILFLVTRTMSHT